MENYNFCDIYIDTEKKKVIKQNDLIFVSGVTEEDKLTYDTRFVELILDIDDVMVFKLLSGRD